MKLIKVAAAVLNQTPLDWAGNRARILEAIDQARESGVSVLCLPELCISGYGCEDAFHSPSTAATALEVLKEVLPATREMVVSAGLPLMFGNALFSAACLIADGKAHGFVAKRFLPSKGIHYEPRWFKAWSEGVRREVEFDGRKVPVGDVYFDCGGVKIGFEICEDAWVAERPAGGLSARGVDLILNPSASHFAFGKLEIRKRLVSEGSRVFGVAYVYANLVGNEAGRVVYDGGALIASRGRLVAAGPRFTFRDSVVTAAVVDIEAERMAHAQTTDYEPEFEPDPTHCIEVEFNFPEIKPEHGELEWAAWEKGGHIKEEACTRAVALGLFDYMRKSGSKGFVVSLSGGADSSATACLVSMMVELGVAELGMEGFLAKLPFKLDLEAKAGTFDLTRALLCCVYQATRNSSEETRASARAVAQALGAQFYELDVDGLVQDYVNMIGAAVGRRLAWETDDIALQNIQARVRAPGVWLLANLRKALLLATSNRSEAAVGYATMDGDTCGGLSPIAGIDKAFLRQYLKWLEHEGPSGLHPIPALDPVNALDPTAELRPAAEKQTDEDDLMPYDLLDAIERAAIRDKRTPVEVVRLMRTDFPQHDRAQLGVWVERFFRLWCRNQWKRERYAPSFHLDDENLDPKTSCRFPILSGGFERELAELRAFMDSEKE